MKQVLVMEFASDISIEELDNIVTDFRLRHGYAIRDVYPVNLVN